MEILHGAPTRVGGDNGRWHNDLLAKSMEHLLHPFESLSGSQPVRPNTGGEHGFDIFDFHPYTVVTDAANAASPSHYHHIYHWLVDMSSHYCKEI